MRPLNICIDIDGTITDPYYWLKPCNEFFKKDVGIHNVTDYAIYKVMGIEKKDYEDFYAKYKFRLHANPTLREDAKTIINTLNHMHRIHFVTAREQELEALSYMYLRRHKISYNSLHVIGSPNKVHHAKLLDCDIFIEDSLSNAIELANGGFNVLLLDTHYNQNIPSHYESLITRVYSWLEINALIQHFATNSQAIS